MASGVCNELLTAANAPDCTRPVEVCIAPWSTMVHCDPDEAKRMNFTGVQEIAYTGYEIELFKAIAISIGWHLGREYHFHCLGWGDLRTAMNGSLSQFGIRCDIAAAGLFMLKEDGFQYATIPTFTSETLIMVLAPPEKWSFADSLHIFKWDVWLFITMCAVGTGLLILIYDRIDTWHAEHVKNTVFHSLGAMEQRLTKFVRNSHISNFDATDTLGEIGKNATAPLTPQLDGAHSKLSKLLYGLYGLVLLTLHSIWESELTARMTIQRQGKTINTLEELVGKNVGVYYLEKPHLEEMGILQHRINLIPLRWNDHNDESDFLVAMRGGCGVGTPPTCSGIFEHVEGEKPERLDALLFDGSVMWNFALNDCSVSVSPTPYKKVYQGLAFPRDASQDFIKSMSHLLMDAQMAGILQSLENRFYLKQRAVDHCSYLHEPEQIGFSQIHGIALVGGVAAALTMLFNIRKLLHWFYFRKDVVVPTSSSGSDALIAQGTTDGLESTRVPTTASSPLDVKDKHAEASCSSLQQRQALNNNMVALERGFEYWV